MHHVANSIHGIRWQRFAVRSGNVAGYNWCIQLYLQLVEKRPTLLFNHATTGVRFEDAVFELAENLIPAHIATSRNPGLWAIEAV
jgi:hypothetical protein